MELTVYTKEGKKSRSMALPEAIFGAKKNTDLVQQVVSSMMSSARTNVAHTKTRGEVSGGGKKPWKQKGTGRARHGSTRSPIWVGGGIAHGPRNDKNFFRKVNRKMKTAAMKVILSEKARMGQVVLVENFALAGKTKDGVAVVKALATGADAKALSAKKKNAGLILFPTKDSMTERALQNIGNLEVGEVRNVNPVSLLSSTYVVFVSPEESFSVIEGGAKGAAEPKAVRAPRAKAPKAEKKPAKAKKASAKKAK